MSKQQIEECFRQFVSYVNSLPSNNGIVEDSDRLELYGLYKQSMIGDCDIEQPAVLNLEARAKYHQWKSLEGMNKHDAMKKYVAKIVALQKTHTK